MFYNSILYKVFLFILFYTLFFAYLTWDSLTHVNGPTRSFGNEVQLPSTTNWMTVVILVWGKRLCNRRWPLRNSLHLFSALFYSGAIVVGKLSCCEEFHFSVGYSFSLIKTASSAIAPSYSMQCSTASAVPPLLSMSSTKAQRMFGLRPRRHNRLQFPLNPTDVTAEQAVDFLEQSSLVFSHLYVLVSFYECLLLSLLSLVSTLLFSLFLLLTLSSLVVLVSVSSTVQLAITYGLFTRMLIACSSGPPPRSPYDTNTSHSCKLL